MISIRQGMREYLAVRRSMGFKLCDAGSLLPQFASFLQKEHAPYITTELALRWAIRRPNAHPGRWSQRLRAVRKFAQYWKGTDPRTEIPPADLLPHRHQRRPPFLFTDNEIRQLLEAAKGLPPPTGLRRWTYSTLIGLLSATGMRIAEVRALSRDDLDLGGGFLVVRKSKFGKSRLVPIHPSTQAALLRYARRRDELYRDPKDPAFFLSSRGKRLDKCTVGRTFRKLSHQTGLRRPPGQPAPRLHGLRHHFAVRTLLGWYRAGLDVQSRIPVLSTYLGHTSVSHTYWYLSAVPELLSLASVRLEKTLGELS